MKIIVFGATGGVGQEFIRLAIEKGHDVTAFVRKPEKLLTTVTTVIQGDAFDAEAVTAAIKGHDVVISCVGSTEGPNKDESIRIMGKNFTDAMEITGVNRIIYCASAGVFGEIPGEGGAMVMKMLEKPLADHRAALEYIMKKNITYTIARPMGLVNTPLETDYVEQEEGVPTTSRSIPRASVAHFMVKTLEDETYTNKSIGLASRH